MTFAEMSLERKRVIGHRGKALERLKSLLTAADRSLL